MLNVLINAYAVSPKWGSEPGMGWNWITNLAKYCNIYVITEGEWRVEIENAVATHTYRHHLHFYYLPVSEKVRTMCWNQGDWRFYKYYRDWQKRALEKAREIIQKEHIDILHQLNMIGFREPGLLWKIDKLPFVWGPVGGYGSTPLAYLKGESCKVKAKEILKNIINYLSFRYQPNVRGAMKRADAIVGAYKETFEAIKKVYRHDAFLINETGAFENTDILGHTFDNKDFNLIWVGKYDMRKQLGIAIKTMALLKDKANIHLYIVGTGVAADVKKYTQMIREYDLGTQVHLMGKLSNEKTLSMMKNMDLFFFTSINDATSTVVLEAISNALPIICHNTRGFGVIVDDNIGRKVQVKSPDNSVHEFAKIIRKLESDRKEVSRLSANCRQRQKEISWDANARKMVQIYTSIIQDKNERR